MIDFINYYYNFNIKKLHYFNNNMFFVVDNEEYIISEVLEEKLLINMLNYLKNSHLFFYFPIMNKDNELFSKYNNNYYIVLKVNGNKDRAVEINMHLVNGVFTSNWAILWEKRSDYYRAQMQDYDHNLLVSSFLNYYLGLTEIAIANYNIIFDSFNINDCIYAISHKKIFYPNYAIDYFNPCNIIIDFNVRDIAEYIKYMFFYGNVSNDDVINLLKKQNINDIMANLLLVRLLYPSFFFEKYDGYIINIVTSNELVSIAKKSKPYEDLLIDIYNYLKSNYRIIVSCYLF